MNTTEAIDVVTGILQAHPELNLNALRVWRDAQTAPISLRELRSGAYGSYSVLIPRIRYMRTHGFLTMTHGHIRATSNPLESAENECT